MILTRGMKEEELIQKCEDIKQLASGYPDVSFAVGCCVISDSKAIRDALKKADERMYQDKEAYYQNHPEMKR